MQVFQTGGDVSYDYRIAFSPDGQWVGMARGSGRVLFLDTASGERRETTLPDGQHAFGGVAYTVAGLAVRTHGGHVHFIEPGHELPRHQLTDAGALALAATADGRTLFMVRNPDYPEIAAWDAATRSEVSSFGRHKARAEHLAVAGSGCRVAAGGGPHARVWTLNGNAPPKRATYHIRLRGDGRVKCLALSGDGGVLAAAARNQVIAWDVNGDAEKFQHSRHTRAVGAVAISPTQPRLVSGGNDGLVFVYDTQTGKELRRLDWGVGPILRLAFASDGLRCAAVSTSGAVVIWDTDE